MSRAQIWKHVTTLRSRGYAIEGEPGGGYRLTGIPDRLYPQESGESALPYDLEDTDLSEYRNLAPRWHHLGNVQRTCIRIAVAAFDAASGGERPEGPS